MTDTKNTIANLKNLGKQTEHVLQGADASLLEAMPNPMRPEHSNTVQIVGDEFTSLCAATRGPDFGKIIVEYSPDKHLVESKSIKFYFESYRNEPMFHEAIIGKICEDLVLLLDTFWIEVRGEFKPRGGWAIVPTARWCRDADA